MLALLAGCTPVNTVKEPALPPLSSVVPRMTEGLSFSEAEKNLSGHPTVHKFSQGQETIWEVRERSTDTKANTINANNLLITFDGNGKVRQTLSSFCFLPDQEPPLKSTPATNCYQKHLFPFDKQTTYDAIKRLLIISHYQVDHSDAQSELISATGTQPFEGDDDKMMFIKLSIAFSKAQGQTTEVVMSASFSTSEKQSTWVQAGFGGVTLPVPLPFQSKEEWVDTGIVTPKFYLNFYDALTNLIANEYLQYHPIAIASTPAKPAVAVKPVQPAAKPSVPGDTGIISMPPHPTSLMPEADPLDELDGPIDAEPKKKGKASKASSLPIDSDSLADIDDKPIDSVVKKRRK